MKKLHRLIYFAIGCLLSSVIFFSPTTAIAKSEIQYRVFEKELYTLHVIEVPNQGNYLVSPQVNGELQEISNFIDTDVVAAINGGYFDPINHKTTSFITKNSYIEADPRFNSRLMDNLDLKPYLGKVLNRSEFRRYQCDSKDIYDIQLHLTPVPQNCFLMDALGGGPSLLPNDTSQTEGFTDFQNGKIIRDAIGQNSLNSRSAVGITAQNNVLFVLVAQKQGILASGVSIPQLAEIMKCLGAIKAMNLDGGSSSSLYFDDQVAHGKLDDSDNTIRRPIKSILSVKIK